VVLLHLCRLLLLARYPLHLCRLLLPLELLLLSMQPGQHSLQPLDLHY